MDNLLVAIIAGLFIIAVFMWNNQGNKTKKTEISAQATTQPQEKPKQQKKKKQRKRSKKKGSKKKGKQQQDAKAAPQEDTKEPEVNTNESQNETKQQDETKTKTKNKKNKRNKKNKKAPASTKAPKKKPPPDDGGGWVTAGKKKKKKQPRGFNANATDQNVTSIVVPTNKIGILIGTKGVTLRAIEAKSGCQVQMPGGDRGSAGKDSTIKLTGTSSQRQLGKAIIKDFVELGFSPRLKPGMKVHNVAVSASLLPILRGNKFAALKALEADGNVKISIPETSSSSTKSVRVKVAGTLRGIDKTKKNLIKLNMHYHCEATHPGLVHKELFNCDMGILVGPKGQTIKSIQGDTKAKIYTPKNGSANQNVVIVGTKAQVVKALQQVQRVLGTDLKTLTTKAAPAAAPADDDFYVVEEQDVDGYAD